MKPRRRSRRLTIERTAGEAQNIQIAAAGADWHPLAAAYHFGTKDASSFRGEAARAAELRLAERARTDPPPRPFKKITGKGIALPTRQYSGEFARTLLGRRTWRGFGRRALASEDLGSLLDLTFGYQMDGQTPTGRVLFKTSPSGGGCHPIEAYVLVLRVSEVSRGIYHYSPRTRRLHLIRRGATPALVTAYLSGQTWFGGAAALVLMTAVLPRVWWRYPHPRSYRSVLLEAGHVCQTFCLVATWLGLAPFCTMATADSRIERDLRIDGTSEVLLYAAGVGSKPADGRWVQWPGNRPALPPARTRRG